MLLLLSACGGEQKQNTPEVKEDLKARQSNYCKVFG